MNRAKSVGYRPYPSFLRKRESRSGKFFRLGPPVQARGKLVWGLSCQAISPPLSVAPVAARRLDRLKLLEVEFGDGLQLVCQR